MSDAKPKIYASKVGRRKEATAAVRLIPGSGKVVVNGRPGEEYFATLSAKRRHKLPFEVVSVTKYDASVKVHGGGPTGQLDATTLGIARALSQLKAEYKKPLRDAGFLTRDPRTRQRRQVGTGGKSRRQKQSPKR